MKKILWVNPSFLDYRIPLYSELNVQLKGKFHLLYSKSRIPPRCHSRIKNSLRENAHFIEHEKIFTFGKNDDESANRSLSIPFPTGLFKEIKKIKPSLLIAEGFFQFTPWALFYSLLYRTPLFIAYERTAHTERNCPWWRKLYRKFVSMFVKGYLANGSLTKEYLITQGINENKIFSGCMCADSQELRIKSNGMSDKDKRDFEEKIGLDRIPGIRYIYIGKIIERKGLIFLLNVWREHIKTFPDDELLIVGEGPLLDLYQKEYVDLDSIKFLGNASYDEIYKFYSISDVFVMPTLEDNWSLVVPEAMACGLPIACSIYNGCYPELVQNDVNGITFDPLDASSTQNALAYFHNVDLKKMGEASKIIECEYTPEKVAQNIFSAINQEFSNSNS